MKKILLLLLPLMASCESISHKEELASLRAERDSLENIATAKSKEIESYEVFIGEIAQCLDSITVQEQMLVLTNSDEYGNKYSKKKILANIRSFEELLTRQRMRIGELCDSLLNLQKFNSQIAEVASFLTSQIEQKNEQIRKLQIDVAAGKRDIASLRHNLEDMMLSNQEMEQTNQTLTNIIEVQDRKINEGYFIVETIKQLKELGLLKGGFFSKKTIDVDGIDKSKFTCVDIRKFRELQIEGKSPKILSQMPADSYHWDGNTLVIDHPDLFWSVSSYLIIQVK